MNRPQITLCNPRRPEWPKPERSQSGGASFITVTVTNTVTTVFHQGVQSALTHVTHVRLTLELAEMVKFQIARGNRGWIKVKEGEDDTGSKWKNYRGNVNITLPE